jgi:elongation factor P
MASTSDIKNGLCIDFNNDIYTIVEFQHVKPGKGNAFVRTRLKSLTSGRVLENTFPSGHKIDVVRVERRKFQYLYMDDNGYNFMDNESYEQISIMGAVIDSPEFLKEGIECEILFHAEKEIPLIAELPAFVVAEITYTEPGIKGDTANSSLKPATLETGAVVKVPLFVNIGDKIKIDTRTKEYIERAK